MSREISDEKFKKGVIITFVCIILVLSAIAIINFTKFKDNSGPDGTEWVDGKVISVTTTSERVNPEKNVVVYDCEVVIQYKVDGRMYERNCRLTDSSTPIFMGDTYYVCVYEDDPTNIYHISTSKGNTKRNFNLIGDLIPIVIFGVIFICIIKKGVLDDKSKRTTTYDTYSDVPRSTYYNDTYNNDTYNNDTYNNDTYYNGQMNHYDEYNTRGRVSDYSGTSLKE